MPRLTVGWGRVPTAPREHRALRYEVALIGVDGSRRVVPVIADRGPLKAVYLASSTLKSVFGKAAWEVTVEPWRHTA